MANPNIFLVAVLKATAILYIQVMCKSYDFTGYRSKQHLKGQLAITNYNAVIHSWFVDHVILPFASVSNIFKEKLTV